ncbi:hypothetical protein CO540_10335 [Micromonospora sp. WMMA2032]|nr:hypothetical protein CO540_10335 [Micromonospora sp. WMMA2032]
MCVMPPLSRRGVSVGFFRLGTRPDPATVVTLVDELKDRFGVEPVLRVLNIAVSTYYGWLAHTANPSARRREDADLAVEIAETHDVSGGTYGSPRVHAMLRRQGRHVDRKRVERLMRDAGLQGAFLRKKWRIPSTRSNPRATPAPDLVNRQITAAAQNRLWVADATRIPCGVGVFWLAAVRDVFSNRIVGWRCSDRCDTDRSSAPSNMASGRATSVTARGRTTRTSSGPGTPNSDVEAELG